MIRDNGDMESEMTHLIVKACHHWRIVMGMS